VCLYQTEQVREYDDSVLHPSNAYQGWNSSSQYWLLSRRHENVANMVFMVHAAHINGSFRAGMSIPESSLSSASLDPRYHVRNVRIRAINLHGNLEKKSITGHKSPIQITNHQSPIQITNRSRVVKYHLKVATFLV